MVLGRLRGSMLQQVHNDTAIVDSWMNSASISTPAAAASLSTLSVVLWAHEEGRGRAASPQGPASL